jgi:uncharacterized LabA/DUF88 family protein
VARVSFPLRYATLLDGAFVIRKLESRLGAFPKAEHIETLADSIDSHECVAGLSRLRTYFYHARPATDVLVNPISKQTVALAGSKVYCDHEQLLESLEATPDFALRLGETSTTGWKVGVGAFHNLIRRPRAVRAADLVPAIEQKGVDLRIGLDIARLALTHSVQAIVVVTADSDLIPALKFARREGLRVFLCHLDHRVKRDLKAHADRIIKIPLVSLIAEPIHQVAA